MKKTILSMLGLLLCSLLRAEDITVIDWNVLRIDSAGLPVYCETVPLAADYGNYDFDVKVEYPEWQPLTQAEAQAAARHDVPAALQVSTHVGTMSRKGFLDISFVPVVRRGEGYEKLTSCRLTVLATPRPARAAATRAEESDTYAPSSVLSTGRWVKIAVSEEGVYRLTRQQLASMGFKDPARVRIHGYGGHLLPEVLKPELFYDDLPETPVLHDEDGSLLFWANGLVKWDYNNTTLSPQLHTTNYCSTHAFYFLTEGEPSPVPQEPSINGEGATVVTTFTNRVVLDKDEFAWAPLGRRLFDKASTLTGARSYTIGTPGAVEGSKATIQMCLTTAKGGVVTPAINGETKPYILFDELTTYDKASINTALYETTAQGNAVQVMIKASGLESRLDYIEVGYQRKLECEDALMFHPAIDGPATFKFGGNTSDMVLWRLPEPTLPAARIMPAQDGTFTVADAQHRFLAFKTTASFPSPAMAGEVPNQDLHAGQDEVDMVIITPASGIFDSEAQRLADAHAATDGLRCRVVRADRIYNEFSSGTPDVSAYRMYMKMLYDRQQQAPRHLLLFGDCAFDNRMLSSNWKGYSPDNFLLCYESDNSWSDTGAFICEEYLGMMDKGEGLTLNRDKADINVGRFPVRTLTEARTIVDKTIRHLKGVGGAWNNRIVMLGDDGDNNSHMDYANRVAAEIEATAPDMEVCRVMWDAYKRESSALTNTFPDVVATINRLNKEGALMFNYTGHGAAYVLSHESVILLEDIKKWTNNYHPLWFTAACDVMPLDGQAETIGEQMVLNRNGGAVAFVGTTRTVYAAQNYTLNNLFCRYLLSRDPMGRRYSVGDALRMAKNNSGASNTENKLHFVLVGDPSLVFGNPESKVVLDSINGEPVNGQMLRAGSRATMTGHIVDAGGNPVKDFNGLVTTRVLDSEVTVTCNNAANVDAGPYTFTDRSKVLYEGADSVREGQFSLSFIVPVDINYSGKEGRVNFYATSDSIEANGHSTSFLVGGISNELISDTHGPDMFITLDDNEFVDGGKVNSTPCFMAALRDSSGINTCVGTVGHNLELSIDGKAGMTWDLSGYYTPDPGTFGQGQVAFTIPQLEPGRHTLTFRACDLLNNASQRSLSFVVDKDFTPSVSQVRVSPNPASTFTNIYVTHNCNGSSLDVEINVYDYAGRLLHTFTRTGNEATKTVYVTWDLTSASGSPLPAGIYLVRSRICRDGVWSEGEAQKLFIQKQ